MYDLDRLNYTLKLSSWHSSGEFARILLVDVPCHILEPFVPHQHGQLPGATLHEPLQPGQQLQDLALEDGVSSSIQYHFQDEILIMRY